jgi:hypothetical protein
MKRQHLPLYAIALAIGFVGALAVGVPFSTLAFGLLVLTCPLMMLFMHGGHGGHGGVHGSGEARPPAKDDHAGLL